MGATPELEAYVPHGNFRAFFTTTCRELLLEGPAGTGKTRAGLERVRWLGEDMYPGSRFLFLRDTRKSLNESVLNTWEEKGVLTGASRRAINGNATREHRDTYTFPYREVIHEQGPDWGHPVGMPEYRIPLPYDPDRPRFQMYAGCTKVVLGGMDHPERTFSTEYDYISCFEAIEFTEDGYILLMRALRNAHMPFQQIVLDTNPGAEFHWINQKFPVAGEEVDGRLRLLTRHVDNPSLSPSYVTETLDKGLHGHARARLFLGLWVSAEGQVWENYDPAVHCIRAADLPEMSWYFGSADFGYSKDPGVAQVWGVDHDDRMYRVAEIYRCGVSLDQWAEWWMALDREFDLQAIVGDPSRPDVIDQLNDRLGYRRGRDGGLVVRGADNKRAGNAKADMGGLDMVRWAFEPDSDMRRAWFARQGQDYTTDETPGAPALGPPRLYLVKDALRYGPDDLCVAKRRPTCTEQEIPSYVFVKDEEGKLRKDEPDPKCEEHGCDAMRYAAMFKWRRDLSPPKPKPQYPKGSVGALLDYPSPGKGGGWSIMDRHTA